MPGRFLFWFWYHHRRHYIFSYFVVSKQSMAKKLKRIALYMKGLHGTSQKDL